MTQSKAAEAVRVINPVGQGPFVFVCEHASNVMPPEFNCLGLTDAQLQSHIAWDPGAFPVAEALSTGLDGPLVVGCASRLLFDCNRPPDAADAIPARSEVHDVPGNRDLSEEQMTERVRRFHDPFRAGLTAQLDLREEPPVIVTIHSFTPTYYGKKRPVEIGLLHDADDRLACAMMACKDAHTSGDVRLNEPYGPQDGVTHTLQVHALPRNALNVMIEVRNDLLSDQNSQAEMARMLASWLREALSRLRDPGAGGEAG